MLKKLGLSLLLFALCLFPVRPLSAVQLQLYGASILIDDPRPSQGSNWTIQFSTSQIIPPDGSLYLEPQTGTFDIPVGMDFDDLDLSIGGSEIPLAATPGTGASSAWGVTVVEGTSGSIRLINNDTDSVAANTEVIIEVGTIATAGATGDQRVVNPSKIAPVGTGDSVELTVTSRDASFGTIDKISLLVAIIESTSLYVGTRPNLTFTISGVTAPADGTISANIIDWRDITAGVPKTATMKVKVNTGATDGFTVYIRQNQNLTHDLYPAIDIDPIKNVTVGTNDSPVAWTSPTGTVIAADTGFLGYTTSDTTLNNVGDGIDRFAGGTLYAGLNTTLEEILYHNEATQSDIEGQDFTHVTFRLEVNTLQPSGNYTNEVLYVVKPIF